MSTLRTPGIAFALSCLFLLQAAGWFLACGILQVGAKHAAHAAMHRRGAVLQNVTISGEKLRGKRVGKKEIWLDGRLYDIKKQHIRGDSVCLVLYHDRREEALLKTLCNVLSPDDGAAQTPLLLKWLARWLGSAFLLPALPALPLAQRNDSIAPLPPPLPAAQTGPACISPPPES